MGFIMHSSMNKKWKLSNSKWKNIKSSRMNQIKLYSMIPIKYWRILEEGIKARFRETRRKTVVMIRSWIGGETGGEDLIKLTVMMTWMIWRSWALMKSMHFKLLWRINRIEPIKGTTIPRWPRSKNWASMSQCRRSMSSILNNKMEELMVDHWWDPNAKHIMKILKFKRRSSSKQLTSFALVHQKLQSPNLPMAETQIHSPSLQAKMVLLQTTHTNPVQPSPWYQANLIYLM